MIWCLSVAISRLAPCDDTAPEYRLVNGNLKVQCPYQVMWQPKWFIESQEEKEEGEEEGGGEWLYTIFGEEPNGEKKKEVKKEEV